MHSFIGYTCQHEANMSVSPQASARYCCFAIPEVTLYHPGFRQAWCHFSILSRKARVAWNWVEESGVAKKKNHSLWGLTRSSHRYIRQLALWQCVGRFARSWGQIGLSENDTGVNSRVAKTEVFTQLSCRFFLLINCILIGDHFVFSLFIGFFAWGPCFLPFCVLAVFYIYLAITIIIVFTTLETISKELYWFRSME